MPNKAWIEHAYPLQQLTIKLQGTRQTGRADLISLLERVTARLKAGQMAGAEHDDDFGYSFEYRDSVPGPSFFEEEGEQG